MHKFPTILSDNNPVPCAVLGTRQQYQNAIDAFLTCAPSIERGAPHLSDQIAVQQLGFPAIDICREAGTPRWRDAKLIHYSHAACGRERSKYMQKWPDEEAPKTEAPEPDRAELMEKIKTLARKNAGRGMALARMIK